MALQNLNNVKAPTTTSPQAVDGKREFEQLMDELCTLANKVRVIVGSLQDPIVLQIKRNNIKQRDLQILSTITQGVLTAIAGQKIAEIASLGFNAWSINYQNDKEHFDHLKNHWAGIAQATSQLSMNLETKRQQHDQKEAQRNAMQ